MNNQRFWNLIRKCGGDPSNLTKVVPPEEAQDFVELFREKVDVLAQDVDTGSTNFPDGCYAAVLEGSAAYTRLVNLMRQNEDVAIDELEDMGSGDVGNTLAYVTMLEEGEEEVDEEDEEEQARIWQQEQKQKKLREQQERAKCHEMIKRGVRVWNRWYAELSKPADLYDIDLKNTNLKGINLQGAWIRDSNLKGANLQGANLQKADLGWANLQGANLQKANLQGTSLFETKSQRANFKGAFLRKVDLSYADLRYADLRYADLKGANLRGANLKEADLQRADLQNAFLPTSNLASANLQGANLKGAYYSSSTVFPKGFDLDRSGVKYYED